MGLAADTWPHHHPDEFVGYSLFSRRTGCNPTPVVSRFVVMALRFGSFDSRLGLRAVTHTHGWNAGRVQAEKIRISSAILSLNNQSTEHWIYGSGQPLNTDANPDVCALRSRLVSSTESSSGLYTKIMVLVTLLPARSGEEGH